ncbi:hypothetical protein [Rhizobium binxianense]|uniref:hypothetical protein n=1 Tax=Rhizobium binxianense TaxID=3024242 RepID=UPI0023610469|nr:hypothetical protein [Rhizobium sp. MJ37]MDC9834951.1 hypothetical protein [Rhizobium sp. MJ37]
MSVKGTTALVRLASNPGCEILGAMVLESGSEKRFYERVVGVPYDREFGERQSSKRRGAQFEQNAYAGDGRLLREAFASYLGLDPASIVVRNLLDDHSGTKDDARIARLGITRALIKDARLGKPAPHIIIQPQLLLPTKPGPKPYFFVAPDLLILAPQYGVYLPGDLKSFVVRENELSKGDLARVRLQLGAQVLALMHEYDRFDNTAVVPASGMLVFSKPNGLAPHLPRVEDVAGGVEAIRIGIAAFLRHRQRVNDLRAGAAPNTVVADLRPHFQDSCLNTCVMAQWCRQQVVGASGDLGDVASRVLGNMELSRAFGLMTGNIEPADDHERLIARHLASIAERHSIGRAA